MFHFQKDTKIFCVRNFVLAGFILALFCSVSCSSEKQTRCYAYGAKKKIRSSEESSPFSSKVKKAKQTSAVRSRTKLNLLLAFVLPEKKEKSPFETKQKKRKKKKHQSGLFPHDMTKRK